MKKLIVGLVLSLCSFSTFSADFEMHDSKTGNTIVVKQELLCDFYEGYAHAVMLDRIEGRTLKAAYKGLESSYFTSNKSIYSGAQIIIKTAYKTPYLAYDDETKQFAAQEFANEVYAMCKESYEEVYGDKFKQ